MGIQALFFDIFARDKTKKVFDDLKAQAAGLGRSFRDFGQSYSMYVTAPIVAAGALTLKAAGDFEEGMNAVNAAAGGLDPATFEQVRDLAISLGAETQYSASEAAAAIEMLIKNGLTATEVLNGAADAAVRLAAATGGELAPSADVVTDVMAQFNKEATELGNVADQVSGVLVASKLGFDDYRLAIGQAGGVAGKLGVTFEDFNAAIAATSSAFASGSDAGTSFKTFLQRLVPQSDAAAGAMQRLGLEFFDASGNMKPMAEIAEELKTAMAGLSDEAKIDTLTQIFGSDAIRTAIMLGEQGADGINKFTEAIAAVSANDQAEARMQGFNGAMRELGGAIESLQIAIADSGLLQWATDFVKGVTDIVRSLIDTNPELLKWSVIIAGLTAVLGPVLVAVGAVAAAIGAIGIPVAAAIAGIVALTAAVVAFWPEIEAGVALLGEWAVKLHEGFVAGMEAGRQAVVDGAAAIAEAFIAMKDAALAAVAALVDGVTEWMTTKLNAVWEGVTSKIDWVGDQFEGLYDAVVGNSYIPDLVDGVEAEMVGRLGKTWDKVGKDVEKTKGVFEGLGTTITTGLRDVLKDGVTDIREFAELGAKILEDMAGRLLDSAFAPLEQGLNALFAGPQMATAAAGGVPLPLPRPAGGGIVQAAGGGLLGFLGDAIGGLFAGFFAEGGRVPPGQWGIAGERGPEPIFGGSTGLTVVPHREGGGGAANFNFTLRVEGNGDRELLQRAELVARAAVEQGISAYDRTIDARQDRRRADRGF